MRPRSDRALVFMAKWPEPGRAKTRLCPPLTPAEAADLARCFLLDTLAGASAVDADRWLAFTPASSESQFRPLAGPDVSLIAAETPNFGVALWQAQAEAFARGYQTVALVATDIPHLPAERYSEAFAALDAADVALGPCADGGYYLLATRCPTPHLFDNVAWSSAVVRAQTLDRAAEAGLRVAMLAPCDDVDTGADLKPLYAALSQRPGAGHTLQLLTRFGAQAGGVSRLRDAATLSH